MFGPDNRRAADPARFALAAIDLQLLGKIARLAIALQEILQRGAALLYRTQQDQLNHFHQLLTLFPRQ